MTYKRTYTKEDVKALYDWYDATQPQSTLDLGHGLKVLDVRELFDNSRKIALEKYDNPTYSGQIQLLFRVQEKWEEGAGS
ncbi:MAG: hypothetical protein IJT97_11845 [Bacteroidaceae bacterium]|nr:hypothetical protein [Bacteroidaceae bacterium]